MTSRGPIVHVLIVAIAITSVLSLISVIFSFVVFENRLATIQDARVASATDTCQILTALILESGVQAHRLPQARSFVKLVGLSNCKHYGESIRQPHHLKLRIPPHLPPVTSRK